MRSLLLSLAISAGVHAATVTYSDGVFSSGWTTVKTFDDGGGTGTATGVQVPTGGNPDEYRQVTMGFSTSGQQLASGNYWTAATWDPSTQGAIQFVSFSWDQFGTNQTALAYQNLRPALRQGGNFFQFVANNTPGAAWSGYSSGNLVQNSFCQVNLTCGSGAVRPDFSTSGGLMEFGYYNLSSNFGEALPYSQTVNVDNFSVSVTSAVPEPGTWSLLASSAVAAGLLIRRRRNASTYLDK